MESKFKSGSPTVVCTFICTQSQNPIDQFVKKAIPYGYSLIIIATNPVRGIGLNGTQYIMTFQKNAILPQTSAKSEEPELDKESDDLLNGEPDIESILLELQGLKRGEGGSLYNTMIKMGDILGIFSFKRTLMSQYH